MQKIRFANEKEMEVTGVTQAGDTLRIETESTSVDALVTLFKDNPAATSRILYYVEEDLLRGYAGYTDLIGIDFVPNVVKDIDYTVPDDTTESGFKETVVDAAQIILKKEDQMLLAIHNLEAGQNIQGGAIQDLGDVVSALAEAQGVSI